MTTAVIGTDTRGGEVRDTAWFEADRVHALETWRREALTASGVIGEDSDSDSPDVRDAKASARIGLDLAVNALDAALKAGGEGHVIWKLTEVGPTGPNGTPYLDPEDARRLREREYGSTLREIQQVFPEVSARDLDHLTTRNTYTAIPLTDPRLGIRDVEAVKRIRQVRKTDPGTGSDVEDLDGEDFYACVAYVVQELSHGLNPTVPDAVGCAISIPSDVEVNAAYQQMAEIMLFEDSDLQDQDRMKLARVVHPQGDDEEYSDAATAYAELEYWADPVFAYHAFDEVPDIVILDLFGDMPSTARVKHAAADPEGFGPDLITDRRNQARALGLTSPANSQFGC